MLYKLIHHMEKLATIAAYLGAIIILIQMAWITYGVVMRYIFSNPDGMVTEATALLLFPVAFLGLAFALKEDAYPRVSYLLDFVSEKNKLFVLTFNYLVMIAVGLFFSVAGVKATIRAFNSGTSSEILLWPKYLFWAPVAVALVLFSFYTILRLIALYSNKSDVLGEK